MGHKFLCRTLGIECDAEIHDEDKEKVIRDADEHVKTRHPGNAVDRARLDGYIQYSGRVE